MRVMKFGGTSIANAERVRCVTQIVSDARAAKPIVVVSALAGVTDALVAFAAEGSKQGKLKILSTVRQRHTEILKDLGLDASLLDAEFKGLETFVKKSAVINKKSLDLILSFGERLSAPLIACVLTQTGIPARAYYAWDIGLITDTRFGAAELLDTSYALIKKKITALDVVPVVTGFIGKTKSGDITTLGRGGSDYTAAIIGAAVHAEVIQIWKEVGGFMSADPRIVPAARVVPELAFEEASELAYFGAKVLHPRTILPAMRAGVPVQVLNTFDPLAKGTTVVANFAERREKSDSVDAITFKKKCIAVHVRSPEFFDGNGLMARIFNVFEKHDTNIDIVAISVACMSVVIGDDEFLERIVRELSRLGQVTVERNKGIVCAVGGSLNAAGMAGRMFTSLGEKRIPVEMISQAAEGVSITFVLAEGDAEKALQALHKEYIR